MQKIWLYFVDTCREETHLFISSSHHFKTGLQQKISASYCLHGCTPILLPRWPWEVFIAEGVSTASLTIATTILSSLIPVSLSTTWLDLSLVLKVNPKCGWPTCNLGGRCYINATKVPKLESNRERWSYFVNFIITRLPGWTTFLKTYILSPRSVQSYTCAI